MTVEPRLERAFRKSKVGRLQLIRSFATASINSSGSRINQFAVQIEGAENPVFIELHVGSQFSQGIFSDEKRSLHSPIVPPKTNGAPGWIEQKTLIWKCKR